MPVGAGLATRAEDKARNADLQTMNDQSQPSDLPMSGERFLPGMRDLPSIGRNIELEHLHRYLIASEFVRDKVVLDIASGEGYGSALMARVAAAVFGVDVAADAVDHARRLYPLVNVEFKQGDAARIPLDDAAVDVVVSFETIEHHDRHDAMLEEIRRVLRPGGLLIISSPNRYFYSDLPKYANPYHVKELYREEFHALVSQYFKNVLPLDQRVVHGSMVAVSAADPVPLRTYSGEWTSVGLPRPVYDLAFASDVTLPAVGNSFFETLRDGRDSAAEVAAELDELQAQLAKARDQEGSAGAEIARLQAERDQSARSHREAVDVLTRESEALRSRLRDREEAYAAIASRSNALSFEIERLREDERNLRASTSWRVTAPLRALHRAVFPGQPVLRQAVGRGVKRSYDALPVSVATKLRVKDSVFRSFGGVLKGTGSYRAWQEHQRRLDSEAAATAPLLTSGAADRRFPRVVDQLRAQTGPDNPAYVRDSGRLVDASRLGAKVIAFYLPQFHPIPENDAWWGRGFTEWTNVSKAVPQFLGHYQPRLPGELGFYDLRLIDVMRRQAELASQHGVGGFCFHYYWFGGRRLLERPLDQFLKSDIDFPFCVCWANENWTRRWDGLENDILLEQKYGPEDDLAFIEALLPVLSDSRYIRVNGKPLLIVYRPSLFPDPAATQAIWRRRARDAGLGEIFLCMVQFDQNDPRPFGFDAAVEFPPHKLSAGLAPINQELSIVNADYAGHVVRYADLVDQSFAEAQPDYPLIRGVAPSWDNDARKPGRGFTLAGASPEIYRGWLRYCVDWARRHPVEGEALVFVNAWNEWAEGAYLEPDRRYGYAYLEATRQAVELPADVMQGEVGAPTRTCVIIHAFYPDLLAEILAQLKRWSTAPRIIVTTVEAKEGQVRQVLADQGLEATVLAGENRGRDVLPFLQAIASLVQPDELILKLHTKRSLHRSDGDVWRRDLLKKLIHPDRAARISRAYHDFPDLGLVAPEGHLLALSEYWGANADRVKALGQRIGLPEIDPVRGWFVAGSMFYARPSALHAITALQLGPQDFEPESGQVDGTLAHALERLITMTVGATGYIVSCADRPEIMCRQADNEYRFAEVTRQEG